MNSQQVTVDVNVPDGYEIVRYDYANKGEMFIDSETSGIITNKSLSRTTFQYFIVKKVSIRLSELENGQKFKVRNSNCKHICAKIKEHVFVKTEFVDWSNNEFNVYLNFALQDKTNIVHAFPYYMEVEIINE